MRALHVHRVERIGLEVTEALDGRPQAGPEYPVAMVEWHDA